MLDFRYHALSLVAVFLALGIGIVLGVTIGDPLVSEAERDLRSSLRGDVVDAREAARDARAALSRRDRLIATAFPVLVQGRLRGTRVAVVALGSLPGGVESPVRDAIEAAGGAVDSIAAVPLPPGIDVLAREAGRRAAAASEDPDAARALGERVGGSLVEGGELAGALADELPDDFRGELAGAHAAVVYRHPPPDDLEDADSEVRSAFEEGIISGLRRNGVRVVAVERGDTDPSQVGWYEDRELPSVDSVDVAGGRAALVLLLAGDQGGSFGYKDSAEEPLPDPEPDE